MKSTAFKNILSVKKEVLYHLIFWVILAYFALLEFNPENHYYFTLRKPTVFTISWIIIFITTFYFNYALVMLRVFKKFHRLKVVLGLCSVYLFFVGIRFLLEEVIMLYFFGESNYYSGTKPLFYLYDNLYYATYPLIPSTLFWLIVHHIRLVQHHAFISEEKKSMEVKHLQSQLNPHFLFNTLNNIYSLVYTQSDKALPSIEKLSSIMRFTTYEAQKEFILLSEEIDYFTSFIELEQLRHENKLPITLNLDYTDRKLPPLLLSPLVENAIKHGKFNAETPIEIDLKTSEKSLFFKVKNQIGKQRKDAIGGIGLDNLKKRLQIYYPDQHTLKLEKEADYFIAEIHIEL